VGHTPDEEAWRLLAVKDGQGLSGQTPGSSDTEIVILPDPRALAREAARRFTGLAVQAASDRGRFAVALSGGTTPRLLYRLLAREPYRGVIPWAQVHLFWADERSVPVTDPESNFHMVSDVLISHVPIPAPNVHRVPAELEPEAAAHAYEDLLFAFFGGPSPQFDLILLGLGGDGHTASLFPGSSAVQETERLAVVVEAHYQGRPSQRVTLTLPAINAARQVFFLVSGSAKASITQAVLEGPKGEFPAQHVRPTGGVLTWLLDAAAAHMKSSR
jgi:6-phosphogluconolactonase